MIISILNVLREFSRLEFDPAFNASFKRELTKSELLRINLIISIMISGFITGMSVFFILHEESVFDILLSTMKSMFVIVVIMVLYESLALVYVKSCVRTSKPVSKFYLGLNIIIESSFPTAVIALFTWQVNNIIIFFSPFILLYFLFIVLATLHLDFWMSFFTGLAAGLQYFVATQLIINNINATENFEKLLSAKTLILARVLLIILCGIASGFVGLEIKRRLIYSFKTINDRNRIREVLGQQVSYEIVDQIINEGKEIETKKLNVCVMFLDIRNFTPFASAREPEEVLAFQNKLFGNLIDIINKNHGIINQFLGDGFMATFGAPFSQGNDCQNAVNAAIEILKGTELMIAQNEIPIIRLGIGIHCGEAITGNIGTTLRKQFSVIGNVVIIASRIEQLNKQFQSQFLISKDVIEKIDTINADSLGPVILKGESNAIEIFKIV